MLRIGYGDIRGCESRMSLRSCGLRRTSGCLKIESVERRAPPPRVAFSCARRSHEAVKAKRARRSPTCRAVAQSAQARDQEGLMSLLRKPRLRMVTAAA
jgi:hypothetical protein